MTRRDDERGREIDSGLLRAAVIGAPVGVLVVEADGTVVESSGELHRLFGTSRRIDDLADLDTIPLGPIGRLLRFIQAGEPGAVRCERRVPVAGDRPVAFVDIEASVIQSERRRGGVVIVYDTTAAARTGDALARSEANLREAQALAQIGSWDYDIRTGAIEWSDEIYRLFEEDPVEFDTSFESFLSVVHPDDRARVSAAYQRSLVDRAPYEISHRLLTRSGKVKHVRERGRHDYAADGEPLRTIGTVQDVTSLYEAESALQQLNRELEARVGERTQKIREQAALIDQIDDALVVANPDGSIRWWNRGAARIFGFTAEEVAGRSLESLSADGEALVERWRRGEGREGELRLQRADGGVFDAHVSLSALSEGGAELSGIIAVIIDITDQKRVERELRRARDLAERASRAKSEFLSSISHELRTPLHAILGSAELLAAGARLHARQRERVEDINRAGEYLLEVFDNILDLVLIESGSMTVAEEPLNIRAILKGCAAGLADLAARHGVGIHLDIDDGGLLVRADRRRVEQVVNNLLSNAIKFNEAGGRVVVRARRDRSCWVRVEVEDTGAGIAASRLRELFTAFNRLGREGGTIAGPGIGLVLAKRLLELMGGTISASSEVGVGSTFTVRLPQVTPLALPDELMIHALSRGGPDESQGPFTLLYVDDFAGNVQMMESLLAGLSAGRLLAASTIDEAMALAANERPDAVFLDPCALGGRVAGFVSQLRQLARAERMPIYSLCGRSDGGSCLSSCGPVTGELRKPLDVSDFHRLLGELARRKSGS